MIGTPKEVWPVEVAAMAYSDCLPQLPTPSSFTSMTQLVDPARCDWTIDDDLIESVNNPRPVSLWEWMSGIEQVCEQLTTSTSENSNHPETIDLTLNSDEEFKNDDLGDCDDDMVENGDEDDDGRIDGNRPSKKSRGPLSSIQEEEVMLFKSDRRRSKRILTKPSETPHGKGPAKTSALGLDGFKFEFDYPSAITNTTNQVFVGTASSSSSEIPSFGQQKKGSKLGGFQFEFDFKIGAKDQQCASNTATQDAPHSPEPPSFDAIFKKISSLFDKNKVFTPSLNSQNLQLESKMVVDKIQQILKQTLVITPHNDLVYELDSLDHTLSALSNFCSKITEKTSLETIESKSDENSSSSSGGGGSSSSKSSFKTYSEYFASHGYQIPHPDAPLVSARLSKRVYNLTLPKELKSQKEKKPNAADSTLAGSGDLVHLVPDCCQVLPFPAELARIASMLPSVLFRMDQYALTDELRQKLELPVVRNQTLLSALTSSNTLEPYSYERYEFLGDSFLKYSVTTDLFRSLPGTLTEGDLTRRRNELVRNQNLYRIAVHNNFQSYVFLSSLHHKSWMPSWLCQVDCKRELNSAGKLKDRYVGQKLLADIVEALIGAAYLDGGNDVALGLVSKLGLLSSKCIVQPKKIDIHRLDSQNVASKKDEGKNGGKWTKKVSSAQQKVLVAVEDILDYSYENKEILLEALTHPSMPSQPTQALNPAPPVPPAPSQNMALGRVTRSTASRGSTSSRSLMVSSSSSSSATAATVSLGRNYQRLEFLGDAIIDWAVARYLFNSFKSASPAILTELRQVAVCNDTFARICVNLGLESYIQHRSSSLSNEVARFSKSVLSSSSSSSVVQAAPKVLGDVIESLAGSVYVDSSFSIVKFWEVFKPILSHMLESYINPTNSYKGYVRMFVESLQKLGFNSSEDIQYS
jgi:dsRNA-specific ribonuclease